MPGAGMNFELTDDQELIRRSVAELARKFDDQYWMEKDQAHEFPVEFYQAIGSACGVQLLKLPTTATLSALGAQSRNATPWSCTMAPIPDRRVAGNSKAVIPDSANCQSNGQPQTAGLRIPRQPDERHHPVGFRWH